MPYKLKKKRGEDLYWVVGEDGTKHSKEPIPKARAEAQRRALYMAMRGGGPIPDRNTLLRGGITPEQWSDEVARLSAEIPASLAAATDAEKAKIYKNGTVTLKTNVLQRLEGPQRDRRMAIRDAFDNYLDSIKSDNIGGDDTLYSALYYLIFPPGGGNRGGGPIPDRNILQQLADQSYQDVPANRIGQLELVRATPTLKFYKDNGNTIVVAIRGTKPTDIDDVKADAMIGVGQLESAPRYTRDLQTLQQFQLEYPPSQYDYYGVGHSLGGAILDMFLKNGLIKNGVSYNPAVQPQDFQNTSLPNSRVYMESDPLYALMGRNLAKKPETRAPRKKAWWEKAISAIPYVGKAMKGYDLYQSHMLDQFQGGAKAHSKFEKQLRKVGIEPSLYLKEAQRRAKDAGLPYKVLGFADDGEHKLAIPDAAGRMIKFGRVGYADHLIWSHLEHQKSVPIGTADAKRNTFQKSHSAIKGDWKKDPFSPNNLALKVLW